MWISDLAIRRPIVAIVAMLILTLAGIFAVASLETDEYPDVQAPLVLVVVPYPGANPRDVERDVLRPVEERLGGMAGLRKLHGTAGDGYASVLAEFTFATPVAEATQMVRDALGAVRPTLPSEVREPTVERFSETDLPVLSIAVRAPSLDPLALGGAARRVAAELRTVPGVAQVRVVGDQVPELAVHVRPDALRAARVSLADVSNALVAQNVAAPIGRLQEAQSERVLRFDGRPEGVAAFRSLVVQSSGGHQVHLGDVASLAVEPAEARSAASINGEAAITLDIRKRRGASATTVAALIRARLDALMPTVGDGVALSIVQDAGERTARAVGDVQKTLIEGALLTVLVVYLFLNSWRSTVITGLALPVSALASFVAVWAFGFKLETMSLLGLSLAIGILVDDAIVVRENIMRHVHMGKDHVTASREGTAEIGLAVLATTAAIVVVFLPVAFMDGLAGQYFKPFALTVSAAVVVSLFVSFTLDPMLSAYWPEPRESSARPSRLHRSIAAFNAWFDGLATRYRTVITWSLAHPRTILGVALLSLVGAAALPAFGWVGAEFLPEDDRSELLITVESPPGASLAYTQSKSETLAARVRTLPEVRQTYVTVGNGEDDVTRALLQVQLRPRAERTRSARELAVAIRRAGDSLPGATYAFSDAGMSGGQKAIQLQVRGTEAGPLLDVAARLADRIRDVPGAVDVALSSRPGQPAFDVRLDRTMAAAVGLAPAELALALRTAFAGLEAGTWTDDEGMGRKVMIRLDSADRRTGESVARVPLMVSDGRGGTAALAFGQVARLAPASAPTRIEHAERMASVTVSANVAGRALSDVTADIDAALATETLPPGVDLRYAGDVADQREVFGKILLALAVAVLGMYFVLVLQFNSWIEPMAILASLPLAAVGVCGALALTGHTINIMSLIGVILLAGVVAKNAILLVEFARTLRDAGTPIATALAEAGAIRLRPIAMTTVALVAGMLPIALGHGEGAQFRAPLGVAVIGGTITSTALTLVVVPVVYQWLDRLRGGRTVSAHANAPVAMTGDLPHAVT